MPSWQPVGCPICHTLFKSEKEYNAHYKTDAGIEECTRIKHEINASRARAAAAARQQEQERAAPAAAARRMDEGELGGGVWDACWRQP